MSESKDLGSGSSSQHGVGFTVKPKGVVHSPLHRGVRIPRSLRSVGKGIIEIFPQFIDELADIKVGCRIWLLTYCAETEPGKCANGEREIPCIRDVLANPSIRHVHPIGIDQVTIVGMEGFTLRVEGLGVEDGSPVLDIQPIKEDHE